MLECLNGGGFSSKCKSRIKVIRSRLDVIKRKKNATLKYLKKDMVELLQNGLDTNAYGRAEGLIHEMNHSSCYELMEQFCGCILKQLSSMKKQRDCPPESREAVSTLMFAAARFADLPELRDLRCIFGKRYGNVLESCVNQEFVEKIASKPPSMEQKLQLMRDISREFALDWDPKAFRERNANSPLASSYDQPKIYEPTHGGKNLMAFKVQKQEFPSNQGQEVVPVTGYPARQELKQESPCHQRQEVSPTARYASRQEVNREIPSYQRQEASPVARYTPRQEVKTDNQKLHPISSNNNGPRSSALCLTSGRESAENMNPCSADTVVPPYKRQEVKKDNQITHPMNNNNNAQQSHALGIISGKESKENVKLRYADNMVPPYVKAKDSNYRRNSEVQHAGADHNKLAIVPIGDGADFSSESMGTQVGADCNNYKHGPGRSSDRQDKIGRYQENPVGDARHKPVSVRKQPKPSVNNNGAPIDGNEYGRRIPSGRRRQGKGLSIVAYIDDDKDHDEEEMFMDELLLHYSKKPSSNYRSSTILTGNSTRTGRKVPMHHVDDARRSPQSQNKDGTYSAVELAAAVPTRAISLPPESTASVEVSKVPVRAASLQPETLNPKSRHVHPKLPDYDDLAAQFAAMRVGCKVK